jgi:integrase
MNSVFRSPLARELEQFVAYQRTLGYSYGRSIHTLRSFDRYLVAHAPSKVRLPLEDLLRGWLARPNPRKPVSVAMDLATLRQFFRYRCRFADGGFVPGREWAPQTVCSNFVPHVFSYDQIRALLEEAGRLRCDRRARPVIRLLILILYCTGLRFGEATRLTMKDVNLRNRVFHVRDSKGRTRWVPFRADLGRELQKYQRQRNRTGATSPEAPFLLRPDGHALTVRGASGIVRGMLRRLGFKPTVGRRGPRPYDLRHAFAVHRLTAWHRAGVNVHNRLPWLSAYMGHQDILGTEVYLHATSELLELASHRLRTQFYRAELP